MIIVNPCKNSDHFCRSSLYKYMNLAVISRSEGMDGENIQTLSYWPIVRVGEGPSNEGADVTHRLCKFDLVAVSSAPILLLRNLYNG